MKDDISLKELEINNDELIKLGFKKEKNYYKYESLILNNEFNLIIRIYDNNLIISDCVEISNNEKLLPYYVLNSNGDFIGQIRNEYENIIKKIINNCCSKNKFKSIYTNLVINYVKNKYNDELEFLWKKYDNNAIWRNKKNNKWYGVILTIKKDKLGIEEEGEIEIIDLLLQPDKLENIVDNNKIYRGYHMNKKSWITIKLDGSVDINNIYNFIDNSYNISINKK